MYELEDAQEHLTNLVKQISTDSAYGEPELRVDLGHVLAHLNRAWNSRNAKTELTSEQWEAFRAFPTDLEPVA